MGPGLYNWDLPLGKSWKIGERLGAQLRGEFFHVLNHPAPAFAGPQGGLRTSGATPVE